MVRTTRKNATKTGKRASGAASGNEPAQVSEVADAGIADESFKVVSHLTEMALCGTERTMDYLLGLSKTAPREDEPETHQNEFSQAAAWMSEPEWNGESSEEIAETSAASREPEFIPD